MKVNDYVQNTYNETLNKLYYIHEKTMKQNNIDVIEFILTYNNYMSIKWSDFVKLDDYKEMLDNKYFKKIDRKNSMSVFVPTKKYINYFRNLQ